MSSEKPKSGDEDQPPREREPNSESAHRGSSLPPGSISVSTTDPLANVGDEREAEWGRHPESAFALQTSQVRGTVSGSGGAEGVSEAAAPGGNYRPEGQGGGEKRSDSPGEATANEETSRHRSEGGHHDKRKGHDESRQQGRRQEDSHEHRPKKKERHAKPEAGSSGWKSLVISGVLALVCGVAGAWGFNALLGSSKSDDQKDSQKKEGGKNNKKNNNKSSDNKSKDKSSEKGGNSSEGGNDSASASQIPGFTSSDDADTLKKEIKHLSDRVDQMSKRLDQVTVPEDKTPPVLHTLQVQLTDLAREVDQVARIPAELRQIERRLAALQEQMKIVRAQVATSDESSGMGLGAAAGLPPPTAAAGDDPTLDLAIGLFQAGQYAQARQVLWRLRREYPKDARVWYFSALANALASGVWEGETEALVEKGVECERSGTPSKAEIDTALAVLTPDTGGDWLARHRRDDRPRQAKK